MFNPEQTAKLLDNATKLGSTNSTIRSSALSLLSSLSGSSDPFQNAMIYSSSSSAGGPIYLGEGRHRVTTGLGNDKVYVGAANDFVNAGDGNNTLFLGEGFSVSIVGAGNNTIYGGSASDIVNAGDGNNILYLGEGVNVAVSGLGNDLVYAGAADDVIKAGDGNNTIYAGEGHNFVWTGKGNDLIYAGAGDDVIFSGAGNDTIYAGEGNNFISAGIGEDTVYAGSGRDRFELTKGLGAVTIIGFGGNDSLRLTNGITPGSVSFTSQNGDTIVKSGDDVLAILKWSNVSSANIDNSPAPMQIETIPTRKIDPSNSLIGAQIIDIESLINAPKNFITDSISVTNPIDNFKFTLTKSRDFSIVLSGLNADADIKLIQDRNNNGVVDPGELIYFSQNSGLQKDFLSVNALPGGTYYVQIYQGLSTSQTDYSVEFLKDLFLSPLPTQDLSSRYEKLARGIAYEDKKYFEELGDFEFSLSETSVGGSKLAPGDYVLGYSYRVDEVFRDDQTGFFAVGLIPSNREDLSPVLAVRGTDDLPDLLQDINPNGVGIDQFLNNRDKVENWLDKVSSIALPDITGHSLGGALAQRIAADYTKKDNKIGQVITFNSPGINYVNLATFRPENIEGITHYVVVGDLGSLAGQAFLPGNVVLLNWPDIYTNPAVGLNLIKKHQGVDRLDPDRISTDKKGGIGIENIYTSSLTLSDPLFTYYAYNNADWLAFNTLLISPLLLPFGGGLLSAALSTRATVEISRELIGGSLQGTIDTILAIENFDFTEWAKRIILPYGREEVRVLKDKVVETAKEVRTTVIEETKNLGSSIGAGVKKLFP